MLAIALALGSSVAWGISDFLGGLQTRRLSALTVLLVSQPVGLVLALGAAFALGDEGLGSNEAALATGAGIAVVLALAAFYKAMALGSITVVATIGALGVLVPVVGGLAQGEEPGALQLAGAAIAICGALLVSREPDAEWRAAGRTAIGLAALAALGFGAFFLMIDSAADRDPAWTIAAARMGGVGALLMAALWLRPPMRVERSMLPALATIGFCDILANSLFALATNEGLLSLVAVAGSLYSAVTVLLARVFLDERLARAQQAGVALALAGVVLIATGG